MPSFVEYTLVQNDHVVRINGPSWPESLTRPSDPDPDCAMEFERNTVEFTKLYAELLVGRFQIRMA